MEQKTKQLFEQAFKIMKLLNEELAIQRRLSEILDERLHLLEVYDLRSVN